MSFTHSSVISSSLFTNEFFRDVNTNPELVDFMKTIERNSFHTNLNTFDIDTFVDFIYNFIDYEKLLESSHASEWKAISKKTSGSEEEQQDHIKKQMTDIVKNVLTKQFHNEKVDNTFGSFIKRIICNTIGDVCGGFKVTDLRLLAINQVDPMQYIRDNKPAYMREYISNRLWKNPAGGFVVCLENDHGCVFTKNGLKTRSSDSNIVLSANYNGQPNKHDICYLELNPETHKANQAKGIYYTGNYCINEVDFEDIQSNMIHSDYKKHANLITKYKDRVSVCVIYNVNETDTNEDSFWYKKKHLIILHNKSVGTKKDIKKNAEEYACMRKLVDSYTVNSNADNVLVVGDFNLPLWGQDNGYLKLEPEDRKTYPIQKTYEGDHETFITKNLELYSTWHNDEVGYKDRTSDWMQNSQAGTGKRTIPEDGPRNYHTDMVFGNVKLNDGSNPVIMKSKLYPTPNASDGTKYAFPMVSPELTWFSDHQSAELTMSDTRGEKSAFVMDVLNTLSDCCSGQQHFKRSFNKETVEHARQEFTTLLIDYIHNCVSFDGNITDQFISKFKLELNIPRCTDEESDSEESDSEESDSEESDSEETVPVKRDWVVRFKDYTTNIVPTNIMTHNEYDWFSSVILFVTINYFVWYVIAFMNWFIHSDEA